jgi:hypothetical protein
MLGASGTTRERPEHAAGNRRRHVVVAKANQARVALVELQRFGVERYKGYVGPETLEVAPLTILVGGNNSGKTALARGIQLLAGGLSTSTNGSSEPLPLESGGIRHGDRFEDLVTGRTPHGRLTLSVELADAGKRLSLSATVRNVVAPDMPSERQVSRWALRSGADELVLERQAFEKRSLYDVAVSGRAADPSSVRWRGLAPRWAEGQPSWAAASVDGLRSWADGVRYLRCPRRLGRPPYGVPERLLRTLGSRGCGAPLAFAADGALRKAVQEWYRTAFGVRLELEALGDYFDIRARPAGSQSSVALSQSGRGLAHALPVVVTALTAGTAGPGVDIVEHPEAELHPAAHADIAEVLLGHLAGAARPLIVETHSEMVVLRARRRVAEGRLRAEDVVVYWIHPGPAGRGSALRKIRIRQDGRVDGWPDGVFIEDYEEILAIRRAAREGG